jgi:hypothetical protein
VLATMLEAQERLVAGFEGSRTLAAGEATGSTAALRHHGWRAPGAAARLAGAVARG